MKTILDIMGLDQYIPFLDSKIPKQGQDPGGTTSSPPGTPPSGPTTTGKNGKYQPSELTRVGTMNPAEPLEYNDWYGRNIYLRPDAATAFKAAQKEAGSKVQWVLNSGYRSLNHQQALIDKGYPAAAVGESDHGDGIALDIQTGTSGHRWLAQNGSKFGWTWPNIKGDEVHFYFTPGVYKGAAQASTPTGASSSIAMQPPGTSSGTETLASAETPPSTMESLEEPSIAMQPPKISSEASSLAMQPPKSSGLSGESLLATLFGELSSTQPLFLPPKETTSSLEIKSQPRDLGYLKDNASDVTMNKSSVHIQPVIITT